MVDLDQKVQESFAANKGKGGMTKGPKGFLEGALLDKQVAAAHDKFMADVEVRAHVDWFCVLRLFSAGTCMDRIYCGTSSPPAYICMRVLFSSWVRSCWYLLGIFWWAFCVSCICLRIPLAAGSACTLAVWACPLPRRWTRLSLRPCVLDSSIGAPWVVADLVGFLWVSLPRCPCL